MKEARNHVHVQFVAEIHGGTGLDKSSTPARSQDDDKQIQFERVGSKSIGFFSILRDKNKIYEILRVIWMQQYGPEKLTGVPSFTSMSYVMVSK